MRAQREHRRRWLWAMAGLVLAGCASGERAAAPRTRVPLTDVSPIVGRWDGLISGLSSAPSVEQDLVDVVIKSDATYEAKAYRTVGAFKGRGTIALKDGSAIFRGTDGDTATGQLFDVGGSRVLEIETTGSGGRRLTARLSPRR